MCVCVCVYPYWEEKGGKCNGGGMCLSMVNGLTMMGKRWPRPKLACGVGAMVSIRVYRLGSRPWEVWFLCELGAKACFGRCSGSAWGPVDGDVR